MIRYVDIWPLCQFGWWRECVGGSWARVNGAFYGKRWIYLGAGPHDHAEEWRGFL